MAWDAAVADMEESRSRRLAECNADRSLSASMVEVSESEAELEPEAASEVGTRRGGSFSSRVDMIWGGWGLSCRGGDKVLAARLTGMLRSGVGRSSFSDDDRFRVNVGGMGDPPPADGRGLDRNPAWNRFGLLPWSIDTSGSVSDGLEP